MGAIDPDGDVVETAARVAGGRFMNSISGVRQRIVRGARIVVMFVVGWIAFATTGWGQEALWEIKTCDARQPSWESFQTSSCSITLKANVLRPESERLAISRVDQPNVLLERVRVTKFDGGFVWIGRVKDEPHSSAVFTVIEDTVVGDIALPGGVIVRLRTAGKNVPIIEELNRKGVPRGRTPAVGAAAGFSLFALPKMLMSARPTVAASSTHAVPAAAPVQVCVVSGKPAAFFSRELMLHTMSSSTTHEEQWRWKEANGGG